MADEQAPCKGCGGTGSVIDVNPAGGIAGSKPCPDCRGLMVDMDSIKAEQAEMVRQRKQQNKERNQ